MQLGMVGLGRMGANMTERLLAGGHNLVVYDISEAARRTAAASGAEVATSLQDLAARLQPPRAVWLMLPAGQPTEDAFLQLVALLQAGDTLVDGGNSNYQDSQRRAAWAQKSQLTSLDVGTSGGVWGRTAGYSLMVGGGAEAVARLRPVFETLAPSASVGWGHVGPCGAGHFVKMIHNGIEYGMMQAYAEGFHIMERKSGLQLNLAQVADIWRTGSVVRSWLLDLLAQGLQDDAELKNFLPHVDDSGEGRWTVAEALQLDVPAPVITASLIERLRSRQVNSYANRLLCLMRSKFGGHVAKPR